MGHLVAATHSTGGAIPFMIRLAAGGLLLSLLLLGVPSHVLAQAPSLNWGSEVNPSRCPTDQGYRYLEINVTRKVENDPTLDRLRAMGCDMVQGYLLSRPMGVVETAAWMRGSVWTRSASEAPNLRRVV